METKILTYKKHLNKLAELGWEEKKTTKYILRSLLPVEPAVAGFGAAQTGLLYKIGNAKDAILLRADIDGLKVNDTVAHICGHSSHTAALMGALLANKEKILAAKKSVYFLFQPSEERYPSGGKAFIEEQKKITPSLKYAFATHVRPHLPLGEIALVPGPIMARGDYMEIEVRGKMVHVKNTPEGIDALEGAAQVILFIKALQQEYKDTIRINIGVMQGGLQANTVADKALLKGDIRMKDERLQKAIKQRLTTALKDIEKQTGTTIQLTYYDGYPVVENNKDLTREITTYLQINPEWNIKSDPSLFSFGCEDFCFISEKIPSVFALIGTGDTYDIHEANCTISDEGTLQIYHYFNAVIDWWLGK